MRSSDLSSDVCSSDLSQLHIGLGRQLGLDTVGFLMMAHMTPVDAFVQQALLMEGYGAQTVYCTDSAGYMLPDEVTSRIPALSAALKHETDIVFHGNNHPGMGVGHS